MIIVSLERLHSFIGAHKRGAEAKADLLAWYWLTKDATWRTLHDRRSIIPRPES
jgi:hypothetical protein